MDNTLYVINEDGTEIEMEVILTFFNEELNKHFVLYTDPSDENGNVYASSYDDEGHLFPVELESEWAVVEEVYESYINEDETEYQA